MILRSGSIAIMLVCLVGCGEGAGPGAAESNPAPAPVAASEVPPVQTDISVDLSGLTVHPLWKPAKVQPVEGGYSLKTRDGSGHFSAVLDLPETSRIAGSGIVRVGLVLSKGVLILSMTVPGDNVVSKSQRVVVLESPDDQTIDIPVAELGEPLSILFANGNGNGASEAVIKSVQVLPGAVPAP